MKIPVFFAEVVAEFSGFMHSPDFKPSRSTGDLHKSRKNSRRASTQSTSSRHSINIAIAMEEECVIDSAELHHKRFIKNSHSLPCVSKRANLSSVQEKLKRLKKSASAENLTLLEKETKTYSYRVFD